MLFRSGEPAVVVDKALLDAQGNLKAELFNRDVKASYIISDLLSDMRKTEAQFLTEIGIPNANTDKKERLITDEVQSNDFETRSKCEVWMDTIKECFDKVNAMFGTQLKIEWRDGGVKNAAGNDDQPDGAIQRG